MDMATGMAQTGDMSNQISLLRSATPITPRHSPHPSISSTRSHTPGLPLSLHEYRKQQATPSPPAVRGAKQVKRKAAASGLNVIERVPSLPPTPRHDVTRSFASPVQQSLPSSSAGSSPSPHIRPESLIPFPIASESSPAEPPRLEEPPIYQQDYPSTDEAEGFYRSYKHFVDFGKAFKPIKRLPRPTGVDARPRVPSPLRSESSTSNPLSSTGGLTNSSTFSLSKFPQPPQGEQPDPPPLHRLSSRQSEVRSPDQTIIPAVVHYRGASFDVVNPHKSLYLSSIETPADRDAELIDDYFHSSPSQHLLTEEEMAQQSSRDSDRGSTRSHEKHRRALYDDFSSAYQSITTRSLHDGKSGSQPTIDLPLPPTPVVFRSTSRYSKLESGELPFYAPQAYNSAKPTTSPSFMQRVSSVFNRKKSRLRSTAQPTFVEAKELQPIPGEQVQQHLPHPLERLSSADRSAPEITNEPEADTEVARGHVSVSDPHGGYGYYDVESIYPSPLGDRENSGSVWRQSVANRRSVPFGVQSGETDYSSEVDIQSYLFEFGSSAHSSRHLSRDRLQGQFFQHPNAPIDGGQKDSTIGSILERYNGGDLSEASLRDLMSAEYEDTIQISGPENGRIGESQQPLVTAPSGLSQLDFGINHASSQGSSAVSSPRTPQLAMFPPMNSRSYRGPAGLPPTAPLPLQPPIDLPSPNAPFARYDFGSGLSETESLGTSYGDTRHLLLLSKNNTPYNLGSNLHLSPASAVASSAALPGSDNRDTVWSTQHSSRELERPLTRSSVPRSVSTELERNRERQRELERRIADNEDDQSSQDRQELEALIREEQVLMKPQRLSAEGAIQRIIEEDLKRLSQSSAISHLSGSIYVVSNNGTPQVEEFQTPGLTPAEDIDNSAEHDADSSDGGSVNQRVARLDPAQLYVDGAAADRSAIPKLWGKISPVPKGRTKESPGNDSIADIDDEEDDRDWETVADNSRADLQRGRTQGSLAGYSSFGSLGLSNVSLHPGDGRYQHGYKLHTHADSGEQIFLPSYNFQGGAAFPNRNALTPPRTTTNPYRHPKPLAGHEHPFRSSPPPLSVGSSPAGGALQRNAAGDQPADAYQGKFIADSHGRPGRGSGVHGTQGFSPTTTTFNVDPRVGSDVLSPEPNDDILYAPYEYGSSQIRAGTPPEPHVARNKIPRSPVVRDTSSQEIIELIHSSPLGSSSPSVDRDNSFAKLTYLGPKGNVTGTPDGTGMREAGSSLADSSSPGAAWSSTPMKAFKSSPLAQYQSSPPSQYVSSPLAQQDGADTATPGHSAQPSQTSTYSKDAQGNRVDQLLELKKAYVQRTHQLGHKGSRFKLSSDAQVQPLQVGKKRQSVRASVMGQRKLRDMILPHRDDRSVSSHGTHFSHFVGREVSREDRPDSYNTQSPLHMQLESSVPRLQRYPRPCSSVYTVVRKRKQRLSWGIFLMLCIFPPFLILYAYGKTDFMMVKMSKGEIERCGRFQKKVALWVGVTECVVFPAAIIVLVVCRYYGLF